MVVGQDIMTGNPALTPRELIEALGVHGSGFAWSKGSHRVLNNRTTGNRDYLHHLVLPKGTLMDPGANAHRYVGVDRGIDFKEPLFTQEQAERSSPNPRRTFRPHGVEPNPVSYLSSPCGRAADRAPAAFPSGPLDRVSFTRDHHTHHVQTHPK